MLDLLARNWIWILLRGIAALVFGVVALLMPRVTLAALVLLFGAYALVDGILTVIWAIGYRRGQRHWIATLLGGILEIGIGIITFSMPRTTAIALLYLIAAWTIIFGITQLIAAVRLRRIITGEWLLMLAGIISVVFGILLFIFPIPGALAVVIWIGVYAIVLGIVLISLAFRLRSWSRNNP